MAPEIALDALSQLTPGSRVLDPMMGSGTVVRAAAERGHTALGFDLDPLAVLMGRVWTDPRTEGSIERSADRVVELAQNRTEPVHLEWIDDDPKTSDFVRYWFAAAQEDQLRRLVVSLPGMSAPNGPALRLALSRTIITKDRGASRARDTSHSRPHRTYGDEPFDVFKAFHRAAKRVAESIGHSPLPGRTQVQQGDARRLRRVSAQSVDAIITSPPYLNAIDYLRGHRLSLVWLGHRVPAISKVRSGSVGAERRPDAGTEFHLEGLRSFLPSLPELPTRFQGILDRYVLDLDLTVQEWARVLRPDGLATAVVGNSSIRGVYVDNGDIVLRLAALHGLECTDVRERELPLRRRYLPPPNSSSSLLSRRMRTEVVLSFRRR